MGLSILNKTNTGKAKRLFLEKEKSSLWNGLGPVANNNWPAIERLVELERVSYFDYSLAQHLLKKYPECDESVAAFICHLSISSRAGHLCIEVNDDEVKPDPELSWLQEWDEESNPVAELPTNIELSDVKKLILRGAKLLPDSFRTSSSSPIYVEDNRYYFHKSRQYESDVIHYFKERLETTPEIKLDLEKANTLITQMVDSKRLLPEQAEAIHSACQQSFGIISGGPGTGKTYTAGLLIKVFWECLPADKRASCRIALAAPTGKAASNLQKSLAAATEEIPELKDLQAKTLHGLLGIRSRAHTSSSYLNDDLILIDESSMIDVKMMGFLLRAVKSGARLILLGDPHQLPPVEAGALFGDMIHYLGKKAAMLKKCMRADLKEIIDFADAVNQGEADKAVALLHHNTHVTFCRHKHLKQVIHDAQKKFPSQWDGKKPPNDFLEAYQGFRLLSPLRKGEVGVENINRWFLKTLKKTIPFGQWFAAPIMIVNNDYRIGLFNGEVGVLFSKNQDSTSLQQGDFALFSGRNERVPALLLPKYEYAYCLSVHKSQGSEFNEVLLLMPEGSEVFGKEVLYTAVTRARKKLEIFGNENVVRNTIKHSSHRLSGFLFGVR